MGVDPPYHDSSEDYLGHSTGYITLISDYWGMLFFCCLHNDLRRLWALFLNR